MNVENNLHTHTHTHTYIYRERERGKDMLSSRIIAGSLYDFNKHFQWFKILWKF